MASRASEIQAAAAAAVNGLALAGAPTAASRRYATLPAGTEPPQIVVTVRRRADVEYLTASENVHSFDGQVTVFTAAGELTADDDVAGQWLDAIAAAFEKWATWTGGAARVTNFNDVSVGAVDQFDVSAGGRTVGLSTLKFRIETKEPKP